MHVPKCNRSATCACVTELVALAMRCNRETSGEWIGFGTRPWPLHAISEGGLALVGWESLCLCLAFQ